jgi:hypothetical protein
MTISIFGTTLSISGKLSQSGQFGTVLGTYTSNVGELGNAAMSAMNVEVNSLAAGFFAKQHQHRVPERRPLCRHAKPALTSTATR